ncbi:MAG: hypothetical protein H7A17_01680 [Sinobacteraceae bacterium]|nr:hypothetical protein [Nevskiaceae bacterium]MCP5466329.1 hypothetical protein [Nevskiaceae bacterium]
MTTKPVALLPFVFLSTPASLAVVDKAAAPGALGYLAKPAELPQLIPVIGVTNLT